MLTVGLMSRDRGIRRRLTAALLAVLAWVSLIGAAWGQGEERTFDFSIVEETLGAALDAIVKETKLVVLYPNELAQNRDINPVIGRYTAREAIDELFRGTSFSGGLTENGVIYISLSGTETNDREAEMNSGEIKKTLLAGAAAFLYGTGAYAADVALIEDGDDQACADGDRDCEKEKRDTIVVTGTNIRGVQDLASPSITIDRQEIENSGFTGTEDLFRSLPQNLSDVTAFVPQEQFVDGVSTIAGRNRDRATAVNLRGLGADGTLVLLNGRRRSGGIEDQAVDVSVIPISAIERVETVTGGRSAIYGSEAVAGVVNIVTRKDFSGIETNASYSGNSKGGGRLNLGVITGVKTSRKGFVVGYDYARDELLDYVKLNLYRSEDNPNYGKALSVAAQPKGGRHSVFAAGHIELNDRIEFQADGTFTHKEFASLDSYEFLGGARTWGIDSSSDVYSASGNFLVDLGKDWAANISGVVAETKQQRNDGGIYEAFNLEVIQESNTNSKLNTASLVFDGPLPTFGNITPRLAVGVERRGQSYNLHSLSETLANGSPVVSSDAVFDSGRVVQSGFAELLLPISDDESKPGIYTLTISAAARYDHYSDFGGTFNPQAGLIWEPAKKLILRGAYSTAFQAPALFNLTQSGRNGFSIANLPDPISGAGMSPVLIYNGTNPNLGPASAKTWTIGIDYEPPLPNFTRISLSYFNVSFSDRIARALSGTPNEIVLEREAQFAEIINRSPSVDDVAAIIVDSTFMRNNTGTPWVADTSLADYGLLATFPGLIVLDNRTTNVAVDQASGLDLQLNTEVETKQGLFSLGLNASYLLERKRSVTSTSPLISQLNEVGNPVDFSMRGKVGWQRSALSAHAYVNYTSGYNNPLTTPDSAVNSWTTLDVTLGLDGSKLSRSDLLAGLRASLSVKNILDAAPPEILGTRSGIRFDPANADPLGRYLTLRIMKTW